MNGIVTFISPETQMTQSSMSHCSDFWTVLAQFHAEVEDTNFDLASVRRLLPEMESPVLVVGAGQGLIVAELRKDGFECDGVELNSEMIRQAKLRRGITLVRADARAMPFSAASCWVVRIESDPHRSTA